MPKIKNLKVALIQDWLVGMGGSERCLEVFCEIFPDADIYTLVHEKGAVSSTIESHQINTSFLQKIPMSKKIYRYLYTLMPTAIEQFDFRGYDLVLSNSSSVAKGVLVPHDVVHIAYIHSPMRYAWEMYTDYFGKSSGLPWWQRMVIPPQLNYIRIWDIISTNRVDYAVANSKHAADRVKSMYRRDADVIYPPVDTSRFTLREKKKDYYLMVGRFEVNKRVDLAVKAFNKLGLTLKIVGSKGRLKKKMERIAAGNIEFLGWLTDDETKKLYAEARAFVFPGLDDFGITPLEAMASGTPVIAFGKGGALETIIPINPDANSIHKPNNHTGVFFYENKVESLIEAIKRFEEYDEDHGWNREKMSKWAFKFNRDRFKKDFEGYIDQCYTHFLSSRNRSKIYSANQ
ncbi:MAG: glycosyltransferase [Patescibacteria group bacterium]|nr:glycosyltransferase [Patescibacteria group bacterium]